MNRHSKLCISMHDLQVIAIGYAAAEHKLHNQRSILLCFRTHDLQIAFRMFASAVFLQSNRSRLDFGATRT